MKNYSSFKLYKEAIRNLDLSKIQNFDDLPNSLQMAKEGNLTIQYIPFDYVNTEAKVVLVGITPGFTQLKNALVEAQKQINLGAQDDSILQSTKRTGAFSGSMRPNLIAMLNHLKVNQLINIGSCEALFGNENHLVHTTSILRYPVFVDGKNYNGTPNMTKNKLLLKFLTDHFVKEASALKNAIFIPLGPKVSEGMAWLANQGLISEHNVLHGLPHPSGANAERIAYFLGKKQTSQLSVKTDPVKIDSEKAKLIEQINKIKSNL